MPITVRDVRAFKERGERFSMLTAYDAPTARLVDEAGIPLILVGDSLSMVVLGHDSTLPVTMDDMLHHTAAVARGAKNALIIGDMPFMSFQASTEEGVRNGGRFLKEAGANAVKLEGAGPALDVVTRLVDSGVPVMGHLGLTPQSVNAIGGYRVQGREAEQALRIVSDAKDLEAAGAFAVVLEAVPSAVAREVTETLSVPTIGIGAGPHTDGQVLVIHDLVGLTAGRTPRFVKRYAELGDELKNAVSAWSEDVASGAYPAPEHTYE